MTLRNWRPYFGNAVPPFLLEGHARSALKVHSELFGDEFQASK
jgi:hypothetical protein